MQLGGIPLIVAFCFAVCDAATRQVSAGYSHTCAVLVNGSVKCWGSGRYGRLGYGDDSNRGAVPGQMGDNLPVVDVGANRTVVQTYTGEERTCVLLDDGAIKCWGLTYGYGGDAIRGNEPAEMGDALPSVDIGTGRKAVQLSTGREHTCAVLDDASIKCWGMGERGRLGYGNEDNRGRGTGEMGNNLPSVNLGTNLRAVHVTAGFQHTCAILDDGSVKCWGYGGDGRLGYGNSNTRGSGPGHMGNNLPFVDLGTGRTAVQISAGETHTCALLDNASIKCWGDGDFGQLGYGDPGYRGGGTGEMGDDLLAVDLGTGRTALQVEAGEFHTCALLDDGTIKCWGQNGYTGRLGLGDENNRGARFGEMGNALPSVDLGTNRTAKQVSAGRLHTCAVLDDDSVKCWGAGGLLGVGEIDHRGDDEGEMGDNLLVVDLGGNITASPTSAPSLTPSESPTKVPSTSPTASPTGAPSKSPTTLPTGSPTSQGPTLSPIPGDASLLNDPAIVAGITVAVLAILVTAGYSLHKLFHKGGSEEMEVVNSE